MDPLIILITLLAAPVILLMVLRINAAQIFLSLCLGAVLVEFVGQDAAAILNSMSPHTHGVTKNQAYVDLVLLLLPVVLTTIIMIRSVKGRAKLAFNLLPAIGVGALLALLAVPLMPPGLTGSITDLVVWKKLEAAQQLIITISTLLALLFLWMQRPKHHDEKKK
jgi:hypothetical protein